MADVYDALTSNRVYKDVIPHEEAMAILRKAAGSQFDPDIIAALLARESEFERVALELADPSLALTPS